MIGGKQSRSQFYGLNSNIHEQINDKERMSQDNSLNYLCQIKQTHLEYEKQQQNPQQILTKNPRSSKVLTHKQSLKGFPLQQQKTDSNHSSSKNFLCQTLNRASTLRAKIQVPHVVKFGPQNRFLQQDHKNYHNHYNYAQQKKSITSLKLIRDNHLYHLQGQRFQNSCLNKTNSQYNDLDESSSYSTSTVKAKKITSFGKILQNKSSKNNQKIRQKKTFFKVPEFIKNKNKVQVVQKINRKRQSLVSNFRSIPKDFKTTQIICHKNHESINKFLNQKQINKRFHPRKQHTSMQKVFRQSSSIDSKFKNKFISKKNTINSEQFQIFEVGSQIQLKKIDLNSCNFKVYLKVIKVLAQSQNSSTYLVVERYTGFLYCLKKSEVNISTDPQLRFKQQYLNCLDFLIRQSKIGMFLNHPFLIKTYCTLYDRKHIYQLMEFVEGSTLQNLIKVRKQVVKKAQRQSKEMDELNIQASVKVITRQPQKSLHSLKQVKQILSQLLQGIIQLHKNGITHRDLKPPNIFISNNHAFKIGDFGCSIYNPTNDFVGTVDYVAPEVIMHQRHGLSVDMWAIGCIAYQLYVGQPPFYHQSRSKTIQKIIQCDYDLQKINDAVLKNFISLILQRQPSKRPSAKQAYSHAFIHEYKQIKHPQPSPN